MEVDIADTLPLIHDVLNVEIVANDQRIEFPDLWKQDADQEDEEHKLIRGVLYCIKLPSYMAPQYRMSVLPQKYRKSVVDQVHKDVGQMAVLKTMRRIPEAYVWTGLRRSIRKRLQACPTCLIHSRRRDRVQMFDSQIPVAPQQIVSADLIGPFQNNPMVTDMHSRSYVVVGMAESYPLT